jgi:DNA-binding response OmpR family regulator
MKYQNIKILFVEDDDIARENAVEYLDEKFQEVIEAKDGLEAWQLYMQHQPQIIITDIMMPKINGLELVERIRKNDKKTHIIITSAFSTKEYLLRAIELQLVKFLIKPITQEQLDEALQMCCAMSSASLCNIIDLGHECYFDEYNKTVVCKKEVFQLRTKESLLLELLLKNTMRYVTYEEIEHVVWQNSSMSKDALKTLIRDLKNKLPQGVLKNLSGTGYKIDV